MRIFFAATVLLFSAAASAADRPWPDFSATTLTGEAVSGAELLGSKPTILIVTPSQAAAESTRRWAEALRRRIDPERYRLRDVIALNLPFFISASQARARAREQIPERFHGETWLLDGTALEKAFEIPRESEDACVVVISPEAEVAAKVHGDVTDERLDEIVDAAGALKNSAPRD